MNVCVFAAAGDVQLALQHIVAVELFAFVHNSRSSVVDCLCLNAHYIVNNCRRLGCVFVVYSAHGGIVVDDYFKVADTQRSVFRPEREVFVSGKCRVGVHNYLFVHLKQYRIAEGNHGKGEFVVVYRGDSRFGTSRIVAPDFGCLRIVEHDGRNGQRAVCAEPVVRGSLVYQQFHPRIFAQTGNLRGAAYRKITVVFYSAVLEITARSWESRLFGESARLSVERARSKTDSFFYGGVVDDYIGFG